MNSLESFLIKEVQNMIYCGFPSTSSFWRFIGILLDWKYKNIWNKNEKYLKMPSEGILTNCSWILLARCWEKFKMVAGGWLGVKVDKKNKHYNINMFICKITKNEIHHANDMSCPFRKFCRRVGGFILGRRRHESLEYLEPLGEVQIQV